MRYLFLLSINAIAILASAVTTNAEFVEVSRSHNAGGGAITGTDLASTISIAQGQPVGISTNANFVNYAGFIRPSSSPSIQFIDFPLVPDQTTIDVVVLLATASSGLEVSFDVASGPAVLSDGTNLSFTGTGEVSVVATQPGDANWQPAPAVTNTFNVYKASQAPLQFAPSSPQVFNTTNLLETTGGSGIGAITFSVISGPAQIVDGQWLWLQSGTGMVEIMAEKSEDDLYLGTQVTGIVVAAKAEQLIDFPPIPDAVSTNIIQLEASAISGLPVSFVIENGPAAIISGTNLVFTGGGVVHVVASQDGDDNWKPASPVTNSLLVTEVFSLTILSAHGNTEPPVGAHSYLDGAALTNRITGPTTIGNSRTQYVAKGWSLIGNSPGSGTDTSFTMMITNNATLTWLWTTNVWLAVDSGPHGHALGSGWYDLGGSVTITAVPSTGHSFTGWQGDVPAGQRLNNPLSLTMDRARSVTATFFATFYVSQESGDDANSGLNWLDAKQTIAGALANAFSGDTVIASNGVYGPISVPEGVRVESVNGPLQTIINGDGTGDRAVYLSSNAFLLGFTVMGADTGDSGAGIFAELGATIERCIVRDNVTTGIGGGVYGGLLINSLIYGNSAQAGAGAAYASVHFSTITQNTATDGAGGILASESHNSIVYDNHPVNHEISVATYTCTTPMLSGTGNFTNSPLFVNPEGLDFRLTFESPCLNAGTGGVHVDLAGTPRPQPRTFGGAAGYDIGCFEYFPQARFVWANGNGVPPYETWSDAARTIQEALDYSSGGDRIVVEVGVYDPIVVSNAVTLISLRGPADTIIDGGASVRPVTITTGAQIEGFTIQNGVANHCGGMLAQNGALLRNLIIKDNRATAFDSTGGGLCLHDASMAVNIVVVSNQARFGAGIYAHSTSTVSRSTIEWNTSSSGSGGGVYLRDGSILRDSTVAQNTAISGGGVYADESQIIFSTLTDNTADETGGGAVLDSAELRNSRIQGNMALNGGGLLVLADSFIHSSIVSENTASSRGGGLYVNTGLGLTANLTVADNVANNDGGGIWFNQAGHPLLNSIVMFNTANNVSPVGAADIRFSCISPLHIGEGNINQDPLFVGPDDYHLTASSPCVNAGTYQPWMAEAVDIDGQPRAWVELRAENGQPVFVTDRVDIGADEAVIEAAAMRVGSPPMILWNVVVDAELQKYSTDSLLDPQWLPVGNPFTATNALMPTPFTSDKEIQYYRLDWLK